mmetsp:Transcript_26534/g.99843  ORF Transcript_26534/g.99843 Transcript_26534/m.99843 type:complete len:614 (-) Transcript_26534:220-2061(-)
MLARGALASSRAASALRSHARAMASAAASSGSPVSLVKTVLADSIKPASTHPLKVTAPGGSEASLLLVKGASGELYATVNKCTHYGLPLAGGTVADCSISCPFHGAQFDLRTGDIEDGPAFDKLPVFPVTVQADGFAYVALPADGPVPTAVSPAYCHARPTDGRHFVVVGAGAASHAAVEELRKRGFEGRITVFSKESAAHHYDRTVLSKNMAAGATPAKIQLRPEEWWGARGVELRLGTEVTAVDPAAKTVTTSAGETVPYDACLCATSGPARTLRADRSEGFSVPGAELGGVFVCREPADSAAIAAAVKARPRPDVVVIGSSFIGMEAAAAIATSGKLGAEDATVGSVTVVGMEAEPFERVLGPDLGAAMRALHEARGVSFRMGTSASAMAPRPDDAAAVGSVTLKDGSSLPADVVVVGAGIIPALGYLESAAGVEVLPRAGGVKVDSRLRAAEDLFVCGDIARFPYAQAVDDSHRELRLEHWDVAIAHGRTAARNMLGDDVPFDAVPFFWSGQLGKNIRYAGNAMRWDEALVQGSLATPKATVFYCCGDKVAAVATLQDDPQAVAARDLMRLGKMPSVAQIKAEAKFDLAAYLKKVTTTATAAGAAASEA